MLSYWKDKEFRIVMFLLFCIMCALVGWYIDFQHTNQQVQECLQNPITPVPAFCDGQICCLSANLG